VFYFTKNFYLVDEINEKISQFHSSGLIDFWISNYLIVDHKSNNEFPSVLTMKKFEGIFAILSFGWFLAIGALIFEVLSNYVKYKMS
jgi:hypothetical protein